MYDEKAIANFGDLCYNKRNKMREHLKVIAFCSLFVVSAAGFVVATTLGVLYYNKNTTGQGGFDTPGLPELTTPKILMENDPVAAQSQSVATQDNEEDRDLYYFTYRIEEGDMIGKIAERFGVSQDTLISVNNIKASRLIQPGQYLKIPSMEGILYTTKDDDETLESICDKLFKEDDATSRAPVHLDVQKCAIANNIAKDDKLAAGASVFIPDARLNWAQKQEINGDLFTKPIHGWFYYSSYYGYRTNPFNASKRTFHGGTDMACPQGTKIYAALAGKVSAVGYNATYGYYVMVSHHSGYQTLYGHMKQAASVKVGQSVNTYTVLGYVGSTGMSTGPHLHFGVYKNGRSINPSAVLN
ncbi:MAG: M23 family metallopeptidase [Treponema sp.]|nr:M23 family metallopeptidase [Treponema sp.]